MCESSVLIGLSVISLDVDAVLSVVTAREVGFIVASVDVVETDGVLDFRKKTGSSLLEEVVEDNSEVFSSFVTVVGCVENTPCDSAVDVIAGVAMLVTVVADC